MAYARVYLVSGAPTAEELAAIEQYVVNPVEARGILSEIRHLLRIKSVTGLRLLNRYEMCIRDRA